MTFETLQKNLQIVLDKANVKAGTKQGMLLEQVYLVAMCDNNVQIPVAAEMMLLSGRSVAGYKPPTKEVLDKYRNAQLGYDHGE